MGQAAEVIVEELSFRYTNLSIPSKSHLIKIPVRENVPGFFVVKEASILYNKNALGGSHCGRKGKGRYSTGEMRWISPERLRKKAQSCKIKVISLKNERQDRSMEDEMDIDVYKRQVLRAGKNTVLNMRSSNGTRIISI